MSVDRVTVSLPTEVRQAAQRMAEEDGSPFSAVVTSALEAWMRGRLADVWLDEYQAEFGAFSEAELQETARRMGVPYVPPPTTER